MHTLFLRVWNWYKELPWYWKIIGCLVLVLVFILFFLDKMSPTSKDLKGHTEVVDTAVDALRDQDEVLASIIAKKKVEIVDRLGAVEKIDAETKVRRNKVLDAKTMDELDKLQEELGL